MLRVNDPLIKRTRERGTLRKSLREARSASFALPSTGFARTKASKLSDVFCMTSSRFDEGWTLTFIYIAQLECLGGGIRTHDLGASRATLLPAYSVSISFKYLPAPRDFISSSFATASVRVRNPSKCTNFQGTPFRVEMVSLLLCLLKRFSSSSVLPV